MYMFLDRDAIRCRLNTGSRWLDTQGPVYSHESQPVSQS